LNYRLFFHTRARMLNIYIRTILGTLMTIHLQLVPTAH